MLGAETLRQAGKRHHAFAQTAGRLFGRRRALMALQGRSHQLDQSFYVGQSFIELHGEHPFKVPVVAENKRARCHTLPKVGRQWVGSGPLAGAALSGQRG